MENESLTERAALAAQEEDANEVRERIEDAQMAEQRAIDLLFRGVVALDATADTYKVEWRRDRPVALTTIEAIELSARVGGDEELHYRDQAQLNDAIGHDGSICLVGVCRTCEADTYTPVLSLTMLGQQLALREREDYVEPVHATADGLWCLPTPDNPQERAPYPDHPNQRQRDKLDLSPAERELVRAIRRVVTERAPGGLA